METVRVLHRRCRSRFCPVCGPRYGWLARQRLVMAAEAFQEPRIFTLTVDRKRFESPEAAFDYVTQGKFLARLMRVLGVKSWVRVLELQAKTGGGWPHWHVVIDLERRIDLKKAWALWRDAWGIGGVDLGRKRNGFRDGRHAMMYVSKYLTKYPRRGFPAWVIERPKTRVYDFSKNLRAYMREVEDLEEPESEDEKQSRRSPRAIVDRMAACGIGSVFVREVTDTETGETSTEYLGEVDVSPDDLAGMVDVAPDSAGRFRVHQFTEQTPAGAWVDSAIIVRADGSSPSRDDLRLLCGGLCASGIVEEQRKRIAQRREWFLTYWDTVGREAMEREVRSSDGERTSGEGGGVPEGVAAGVEAVEAV